MKKIDLLLAEYAESHRNPTNKAIHWLCVPLIFWTVLGFISLIPSPHLCTLYFGCISVVSMIAILLVSIFYLRLSWRIAVIMLCVMIILEHFTYLLNITFGRNSWIVYFVVFVITWILQFLGHKIEGKKPSFFTDLKFLLIGPIWLLHFIFRKLGIAY